MISFNGPFPYFSPQPFPLISGETLICPFWTDLNPEVGGTVSHNNGRSGGTTTARVTQLIQEHFGRTFVPTGIFITTWDRVPFFSYIELVNYYGGPVYLY